MESREVIGLTFAILAFALLVAAVWGAIHYSPSRVYARELRAERRKRRERAPASA
jgi:hypothetical protein